MVVGGVSVVVVSCSTVSGISSGVSIGVSWLSSVFVMMGVISRVCSTRKLWIQLPIPGISDWLAAWEPS